MSSSAIKIHQMFWCLMSHKAFENMFGDFPSVDDVQAILDEQQELTAYLVEWKDEDKKGVTYKYPFSKIEMEKMKDDADIISIQNLYTSPFEQQEPINADVMEEVNKVLDELLKELKTVPSIADGSYVEITRLRSFIKSKRLEQK